MSLPSVNDQHAFLARGVQGTLARLDGGQEQRRVVAQLIAKPARQDEIALHVDDDHRGRRRIELQRKRLGLDLTHSGSPLLSRESESLVSTHFRPSPLFVKRRPCVCYLVSSEPNAGLEGVRTSPGCT